MTIKSFRSTFPVHYRWLMLASLLLLICGCDRQAPGPVTSRVVGVVNYRGDPVEHAIVVFQSPSGADKSRTIESETDDAGHFEMRTHLGGGKFKPGLVPGEYAVAISKLDNSQVTSTMTPPKNVLPKKYLRFETSGLSASVVADRDNEFVFELKD